MKLIMTPTELFCAGVHCGQHPDCTGCSLKTLKFCGGRISDFMAYVELEEEEEDNPSDD